MTRTEATCSKAQPKHFVIGHTRKLSKSSHRFRSLFGHKPSRYAAWFKFTRAGSI
jgi:hypothetical protein